MTSGNFHPVPIATIKVPDNRQRKEMGDIANLADSIKRLSLINPIVITRSNELVAGARRLAATQSLGHDTIICHYTDELSDAALRSIELEENVKRLNLTWQEEALAVAEYHNYRLSTEDSWDVDKTAEALGYKRVYVFDRLAIVAEAERNNDIMNEKNFSGARTTVVVNNERRAAKELESIRGFKIIDAEEKKDSSVINADFTEWIKTYDGPRFNFLHCDFPYGIGADKMQQGHSVALHGGYDDTPQTYWDLLSVLCGSLDKLCAESAHIMFWFSMHHYADTMDFFASHSDFVIDPFPLVWMKDDNMGLLPDPKRGPRRIYETCLFGARGDRKIVSAVSNAIAEATDRSQHMSTKPEAVLRYFFGMFVDENSVVLDPTCGSGSALRAAEGLGAAHVLGVEIDEKFAERANVALRNSRMIKA